MPIQCQFLPIYHPSANPMSIPDKSANPMSIHDQSAIPMSILYKSANSSPICQFLTNMPIHHQSTNPSPICQSITNLPIHHQSTNQMSIHHQSANPMSIRHQSANPMSILDHPINPLLRQINEYDTNQLSISCQFSVNLPIHYQSDNPTPIGQSNVNIDESTHLAIPPDPMPQRPYKDHQNCPPIRGNHKKRIDTGLARIGTTSCQSFTNRRTFVQVIFELVYYTGTYRSVSTEDNSVQPTHRPSDANPTSILCQCFANL